MSLIFPKAAQVFHPDKTPQEGALLLCPTPLDPQPASSLVQARLPHHSLEDLDPAMPPYHHHLAVRQGDTELSLPHQEAPRQGLDQASPRLLLHPQIAADRPYHQLQEEGPRFPTTDRRHPQPPGVVIGHLCPATCPHLPPLSTPNLLPLFLPPHPLVLQLEVVHHLSHLDDQGLLLYRPARLEGTTTTHLVCPKGTARSTGADMFL